MEVTDSRAFLQRHHLHNISLSISSPESDPELRAISSAIAHFERLQETTSQCALTLSHNVSCAASSCPALRPPASQCAPGLILWSHYRSHIYMGFMPEDRLHHNICVLCPVKWNLMHPLKVEMSCNDISFNFNYITQTSV